MRRWLAGVALALGVAGPALALPPMWVVRDADSEMVLFGSVHALPPNLQWEPPELKAALARADDVWFEIPIDQATQDTVARLAAQTGILPPHQSLFTILPTDVATRLLSLADAYGVDKQALARFEPWLAEVALSAAAFDKAGATSDNGVDHILWAAAPPRAVKRAFETPEQQIAVLDAAHRADQVASLAQTERDLEANPRQYLDVVDAWLRGDLPEIERQAFEPLRMASPRLLKRLVTDRNARWTKVLDTRLKGKGRTVVVVGVGHLVGPDGLPARLRALGYSVTGP